MLPARFEYSRPGTLGEALELLTRLGDEAKLLAGGHSLIPMMKLRVLSPAHLVDIAGLSDLSYIRREGVEIAIGGLTTHYEIERSDVLHEACPLLSETAAQIGDVQVRNRGTIGGSLAHADPAADYPAAILALDTTIVAESPRGRRTIAAADFFQGMLTTSLEPDEILVEVRFAVPAGGAAYRKAPHKASYFALVGVAAIVETDGAGACTSARIGITGASFNAYRATAVESALTGATLTPETISNAAGKASEGQHMLADIWASSEYRANLCGVYTERAILAAAERGRGG